MATSIISIAIAVAILWVAYRVLFINSNRLVFNRVFLITALGFSLILPAAGLMIGGSSPQIVSYRQSLFSGIMLDEVVITADGVVISTPNNMANEDTTAASIAAPARSFNIWHYIWIVYVTGVGVMALLFLIKIARIAIVIISSPKKKMSGYTAVFTGKEHGSYSFFNYAFFPNENVNSDIVRHEMSHIAHHHSADILFVELMMIIQWFNPFIYLYKRELQSIHEYMADRDVVATGVDKQNYMMLILQQCTAVDFSNMSNNFSFLLTKKRIKMITQSKKAKGVVIKALLTLPLFALLLFANCKSNGQNKVSAEKAEIAETTTDNEKLTTIKIGEESYVSFADPMEISLDGKDYTLDINSVKNEKTFKLGDHKVVAKNNHDDHHSYTVTVDGKPFDLNYITRMLFDDSNEATDDDSEVYTGAVEVQPKYPGGINAMYEFIQKNLKYPESAKKKGIEGRVFVQFVVEKDGSLSSFQVLRGVSDDIDAEAVRVLKMMPKWKPGMMDGKPVRVQFTMPFKFQLTGNENNMTALSGTKWEGRGEGIGNDTAEGMKFVMDMTMDFYNNNDGLFVMKLMAQDQDGKTTPQTVFENVGLDFTYSFDGKSAGSIQPKNTDGSTLGGEEQQPYSFVMQDGKIIVNFYDFKDDCGIEKITFKKK
ncbi:MAG: TonB family protein [Bacteroidales bacterium]|nr:TonB family protein [Bacteroidales bacterium]